MRQKKDILYKLLIWVGAGMILLALVLLLSYTVRENRAKKASEAALAEIRLALEQSRSEAETQTEEPAVQPETELPAEEPAEAPAEEPAPAPEPEPIKFYARYDYIGIISFPYLGLELPLLNELDDESKLLDVAPCREFGSIETNDLVVAGHSYRKHFGHLSRIPVGEKVVITTMDGTVYEYKIEVTEVLDPDQVDRVVNSGYDLCLYTCTASSTQRYVLWCSRI